MENIIAVTIGDLRGIGIYLLIKEWEKKNINNFILISNYNLLNKSKLISKHKLNKLNKLSEFKKYNKNKINILNIDTKNEHTNCLDSLKVAYNLTKKSHFIGILTLPINKNKINKFADKNFIDQTTFFSKLENNLSSNMVFIHKEKIFVPITTHIELKNVFKIFKKKEFIIKKIKNLNKTIENDLNLKKPKYVIAGINPHAGENGLISLDEKKYLLPIIKSLKKTNINILGPVAGDSIIIKENLIKFDVFLFPYHDQALIPFKMLSKFKGVNFTTNLDIIRVSPSHGTANNLVGKKIATSKGILNCFKLIKKIYKNRKKID